MRAFFRGAENSAADLFFLTETANKKNSAGRLETVRAVPEKHLINFIWP